MWRIGGIVAVLLILGLTAAGLASVHKLAAVSSSAAVSDAPAASRAQAAPADLRLMPANPTSENVREAMDGGRSVEPRRSVEPLSVAPGVGDTMASDAPAEDKPLAIPPCDKPGGMGLSRIVQVDT